MQGIYGITVRRQLSCISQKPFCVCFASFARRILGCCHYARENYFDWKIDRLPRVKQGPKICILSGLPN